MAQGAVVGRTRSLTFRHGRVRRALPFGHGFASRAVLA